MYGSYAMFTRTSSTLDRNNEAFSPALKIDQELMFSTLNKSCLATFRSKIIEALIQFSPGSIFNMLMLSEI